MFPNKWDIVNYFAENNRNFLTTPQIDSYNTFLTIQIPKILRQFSPINSNYPADGHLEMYKQFGEITEKYNQKLSIYLGASIRNNEGDISIINNGSQFKVSRPVIEETSDNGVYPKPLYPNECRLKNLTYSAMLYIDIIFKFSKEKEDGTIIDLSKYLKLIENELIEGTDYKYKLSFPFEDHNISGIEFKLYETKDGLVQQYINVPLGIIPIMLHSKICVLSGQSNDTLLNMGECPYGQGGYFIINGKEKVIIAQERQSENKLFISKVNDDDKYNHKLEIRSALEDKFEPPRITNILSLKKKTIHNSVINREYFQLAGKNDKLFFNINDIVYIPKNENTFIIKKINNFEETAYVVEKDNEEINYNINLCDLKLDTRYISEINSIIHCFPKKKKKR